MTSLFLSTENLCSCSILDCRPLNCFSFLQSLKAVTNTTTNTAIRIAQPSIQFVWDSESSSPSKAIGTGIGLQCNEASKSKLSGYSLNKPSTEGAGAE